VLSEFLTEQLQLTSFKTCLKLLEEVLRNTKEIQGTTWLILCGACEEILGSVCSMCENVLYSLNGYPHQHPPGVGRRWCWLPFVGAILRHFPLKKAKPIPHGPGSCGEKGRGSRKMLRARNSPSTLAYQTELRFILQMYLQLLKSNCFFLQERKLFYSQGRKCMKIFL